MHKSAKTNIVILTTYIFFKKWDRIISPQPLINGGTMEKFTYSVKDANGIHARPAGLIVNEAKKYKSAITMECKGKNADCKRLFAVMSLGAASGDILTVTAVGSDEKNACEGIFEVMSKAGL